MQILIDFYIKSRTLKNPFKTARSEVSKKDILVLVFDNQFAFELPLSPSLGEMPNQTIELANDNIASSMVKRALSYYIGMNNNSFSFPIVKEKKVFETITYDINSKHNKEGDYLQRYKASKNTLDDVISKSKETSQKWTVDFNADLTIDELNYFIKNADLTKCLFIEQPIPTGLNPLPDCPVDYWVDEGLKELTPNTFLESNYKGFMLKPLVFSFKDFNSWINFAVKENIPFFISGVVCDNLHHEFMKAWNNCSSFYNIHSERANFFTQSISLSNNPYLDGDFKNIIEEIKNNFKHTAQLITS